MTPALRRLSLGLAIGLMACTTQATINRGVPSYVEAAVADPRRPASDVKRDPDQRPAELFAFIGARPGDKVADFWPIPAYSTRILSAIVGPRGHVYALVPEKFVREGQISNANIKAELAGFPNVSVLIEPFDKFSAPEPLDLVYLGKIYHDFPNLAEMGPVDIPAVHKAVWRALKRGGHYVIVDHAATPGSGFLDTEPDMSRRKHRIDPLIVRRQVLAAGFSLEGESSILRNPGDTHQLSVFDRAIQGKTDRFAFKFVRRR